MWGLLRERRFCICSYGSFGFGSKATILSCLLCVPAPMWRRFSWVWGKSSEISHSHWVTWNHFLPTRESTQFVITVFYLPFVCLLLFFWDRVWLYSSCQPETSVVQAVFLPQLPDCWDYRPAPLHLSGLGLGSINRLQARKSRLGLA